MDARETIRAYYDALRDGDPLGPFFAGEGDEARVKFGISERLVGASAIEAGLSEQTATTTDWTVESRALRVTERDCHAWFADDVVMAWTDTERSIRFEFETRWSGTLERRRGEQFADAGDEQFPDAGEDGAPTGESAWRFVGMHVSTAGEL